MDYDIDNVFFLIFENISREKTGTEMTSDCEDLTVIKFLEPGFLTSIF